MMRGKKERPHHGKINDKLDLLLKDLEEEWDLISQPKRRALPRYSTDSSIIVEAFQTMDKYSPRSLMSSLQQRWSPDDESPWKVKNNIDLEVMEILRERRAAIESGKLKGRRLFDDEPEGVTEPGCCAERCLNQDCSEVRCVCSYGEEEGDSGGGTVEEEEEEVCSTCLRGEMEIAERRVKEGEKLVVAEVEEKTSGSGGKWMAGLRWIVMVLIVCAICFFGYENEDEVILVPT